MTKTAKSERATLGVSEEQAQLLDIATSFCRDKSPMDKVRSLLEDEQGYETSIWKEMADLGWLGIAVPEEFGGIGLSLAEVVPVVEQMGRTLMSNPLVPTTLAAQVILKGGSPEQQTALLPGLASGTIATLALTEEHADWDLTNLICTATDKGDELVLSGKKLLVVFAASADLILATVSYKGAPAIVTLTKEQVAQGNLRRENIIDETRRSYELTLDGITVPKSAMLPPEKAVQALAHLELSASLLLAAEMCGGSASVVEYTVEYLKTRKQFDKIIGSFQALKHPIVDAHTANEVARSHLYSAAYNFGEQGEGEIATRIAKAEANKAFAFSADRAIQFHGGFGFTYECDAQLYRRRSLWCEAQHGDTNYHQRKLEDLML